MVLHPVCTASFRLQSVTLLTKTFFRRSLWALHEFFFVNGTFIKVGKDSDAGTVSQLPFCYLQRLGFAPVRVTGTGTGHLPIAMSDEEARPPLNIPSPNELTESNDERQECTETRHKQCTECRLGSTSGFGYFCFRGDGNRRFRYEYSYFLAYNSSYGS